MALPIRFGRYCSIIPIVLTVCVLVFNHMSLNNIITSYGYKSEAFPHVNFVEREDQDLDTRMLSYFKRYRYLPSAPRYDYNPWPSKICGEGPSYEAFFNLKSNQRSANNEDKLIYETFFKGMTNMTGSTGTFVEIGAFNGLQESNTHFFETCLGWDGLLVEGNPLNYHQVISNREFAHKMSFAPSCREGDNTTIKFSRYPMTNAGLQGFARTYDEKPMVDVPCGPFAPVLKDIFRGRHINFFSLDVEGAEWLVLQTMDFQTTRIDILMIEIRNNLCNAKCVVREQVREKMKKEGYKRYENMVAKSDIYVHPNSIFQIPESVAMFKD